MARRIAKEARAWIEHLRLEPHPEGGYFRETYRSNLTFDGDRSASTAIYFLLTGTDVSRFHRIRSDELWHHHDGAPVTLWLLDPARAPGPTEPIQQIGLASAPPVPGEPAPTGHPQAVVPAGVWFGATVDDADGYALVSCTVAPGFDFRDFELARREDLLARWPHERAIIERLTASPSR